MSLISQNILLMMVALSAPVWAQTENRQLIELQIVPKDFRPADGNPAKLVVWGKRFLPMALDLNTKDSEDAMLAAAIKANRSGDLARILAAWYIDDRPAVESQLRDAKLLQKNALMAKSVSKIVPLTKIYYGKYVVYLLTQQYLDGRYLPTVFPMRIDNGALWMTNDLKEDALLLYLFFGLARQQQTEFLTNNSPR